MRTSLNQFDYEGKDRSVVYPPDPLLVQRGRDSIKDRHGLGTTGRDRRAGCAGGAGPPAGRAAAARIESTGPAAASSTAPPLFASELTYAVGSVSRRPFAVSRVQ
jgi:hypothetical protein